jgi:hypothetical protein
VAVDKAVMVVVVAVAVVAKVMVVVAVEVVDPMTPIEPSFLKISEIPLLVMKTGLSSTLPQTIRKNLYAEWDSLSPLTQHKFMMLLSSNLYSKQQRLPLLLVLPFPDTNLVPYFAPCYLSMPINKVELLLAVPPPLLSTVTPTVVHLTRFSTLSILTLLL